jgi:uncharacterized membrane protein
MGVNSTSIFIFLCSIVMFFIAIIMIRAIYKDPFDDKYNNIAVVVVAVLFIVAALFIAYSSIYQIK